MLFKKDIFANVKKIFRKGCRNNVTSGTAGLGFLTNKAVDDFFHKKCKMADNEKERRNAGFAAHQQ